MATQRQNREAKLAGPVAAWLRWRGCVVYAEVLPGWAGGGAIDLVGWNAADDLLIMCELKMGFTAGLYRQAHLNTLIRGEHWACAPTAPGSVPSYCRGIGLLRVRVEGWEVLAPWDAESAPKPCGTYRDGLVQRLAMLAPSEDGGKPCLRNIGPAKSTLQAVRAYRAIYPAATWKEMYGAIPNHYASAASMRAAMKIQEAIVRAREEA